jgi:uncharacterized protein YjiK
VAVLAAASGPAAAGTGTLTSLWRDAPDDAALVRIDPVPQVVEPSDLLILPDGLYTVSDKAPYVYRLRLDGKGGVKVSGRWSPSGLPEQTDLEALAVLPGGEVLMATETTGAVFVLHPFPRQTCAAWMSGVDPSCFVGPDNCGIEALAVLSDRRLFAAKERDTRAAYLFDLPQDPCAGAPLGGRTYLRLPEEVGPDISAATFDPDSGHLLLVARSRRQVLEFTVPPATPGDTTPRPLPLVGAFDYSATEAATGYRSMFFGQVEGIAVDAERVLHLIVDNNRQPSRRFGDRRAALLRFYPQSPSPPDRAARSD